MNKFIKSLIVLCTLSMTAQTFTMSTDFPSASIASAFDLGNVRDGAFNLGNVRVGDIAKAVTPTGLTGGLKDGNLSINVNFSTILKTLWYAPLKLVNSATKNPYIAAPIVLVGVGLWAWRHYEIKEQRERARSETNKRIVALCQTLENSTGNQLTPNLKQEIAWAIGDIKGNFDNHDYSNLRWIASKISTRLEEFFRPEASKYAQELEEAVRNETSITEPIRLAASKLGQAFIKPLGR